MEEKHMTPKHRDVVVKLRERLVQYRKRHSDCQTKQEHSLAVQQDQERQDTMMLQKRVLESRNTKLLNVKMKQQEAIRKIEHPSNGLELKSTNAILQQRIILKRKHDQGMNNMHMNCDNENGQIGESLTKYQRPDEIHNSALAHEHQISMPSSQSDQQSTSTGQSDSLSAENLSSAQLVGSNGRFAGDTTRSSPLLSATGAHNSEAYQNANRVASPNSLPPTEFKQESHSVAVSCDGGRNIPNGIGLANSSRSNGENKSTDPGVGQELQQQLNDFERVLIDVFKNTGVNSVLSPQHHLSRSQIDTVTRDSRIAQQQNPSLSNPSTAQKNPYPTPPGATSKAIQLQHLARQAQNQRAQAGYMDSQEQEANQQYRPQQMQFMDAIRFVGSQQQMPSQSSMQPAQFSAAGRFHGPMAAGTDQYGNMYSAKDQNHNVIMSTGFPSNTTVSLQYQRMMQSQAQQQQQALYSRMSQQQSMPQRLSHPTIPEHQQPTFQQYQSPQISQAVPQVNNMQMQNLPPYSSSGYQLSRSSQAPFNRQVSMPLPTQGYPEQYAQHMSQYQVGDQQVPTQQQQQQQQQQQPQQTDMASTSYHYNRRNSFPLYHRSMSQPVATYGPGGPHPAAQHPTAPHPGYQGQMNPMRNSLPEQNPATIDGRTNTATGYSYNNRTSAYTLQSGLQGLMSLQQRNGPSMSQTGTLQQRPDQQNLGYAQNMSQDMKYSANRNEIPKTTRRPSFNDPMGLTDPISTTSSDSHYSPFSPLGTLEKAPSFASLLDQNSGSLNNLETTYTGSIPNLDILGEIIG